MHCLSTWLSGWTRCHASYLPPPILNEKLVDNETKALIAEGLFIHPNPKDFIHYGQGSVNVYKTKNQYVIFLNKDFKVGPGPAFHVFLSDAKNIKTNAAFKDSKKYDLGMLKSFQGSQVYSIPNHVNLSEIRSVVIWCVSFSQLITSAELQKTTL
ncbi:MAG: DM13 domain-containing protein [Gammaproteobacteria bacterium]|nr:MAG: DM13 domain-containing protein [Gammaproteobacteria bacterium]